MPYGIDRILSTHVGSLVRPEKLRSILRAIQAGQSDDVSAYNTCLAESVDEVVRQQSDAGIDFVSDGEFGKGLNWARYIHQRITGITRRPMTADEERNHKLTSSGMRDRKAFPEFYAEYDRAEPHKGTPDPKIVCDGPISYTGQSQIGRDIANLKRALKPTKRVGGFLPVVAPASALPSVHDEYYHDEERLFFALADALHVEYKAIIDAGLFLQVDDAFLPHMYERLVPPMTLAEYRKWAGLRIEALNHALRGLPVERIRYHVCWGSWNGPHMFDVPMKEIIDLILNVRTGAILFEAANPRHEHEWHVWEDVKPAQGQILVPGVISHATNIVEHPELIAERIVRLANVVGRDSVMAGTDCGFAQNPFNQRVHPSIMWAKLKALSEGAELATARLWKRKSVA